MSYTPIGVIVVVAASLAAIVLFNHHKKAERADYPSAQKYEVSKEIISLGASSQGQYTDPKAYREEWRAEQDLEAQREMADWALYMMIATSVGVVLIGATLFEATKTTRAAIQAAEASRAAVKVSELTIKSQQRIEYPYLYITITDTQQLRVAGSETPYLNCNLVNHGKLPATLQTLQISLEENPTPPYRLIMGIEEKFHEVIPPGEKLRRDMVVELFDGRPGQHFSGQNAQRLVLQGRATYEDPTGALHAYRFCMRGKPGGRSFQTESGSDYNYHKPIDREES